MKKNRIRLSEAQLHRVIKESVNNVLKENTFGTRNNKTRDRENSNNLLQAYLDAISEVRIGIAKLIRMTDYDNPRLNQEDLRKWFNMLKSFDKEFNASSKGVIYAFKNQQFNYAPWNRKTSVYDGQDELNAKIFNPYTQK